MSEHTEDIGGPPSPDNSNWFREVLGQYPTGVSIIAGQDADGEPAGFVVGTFTSVSLDPPLVGFLPAHSSTTWPRIRPSGRFCVNILSDRQQRLCRAFSRSGSDKFAGIRWRLSTLGNPIIEGAVAYVDCVVENEFVVGDHSMVVGRVDSLDVRHGSHQPILFYRGGYGSFVAESLTNVESGLAEELKFTDAARGHMESLVASIGGKCNASALVSGELVVMASVGEREARDFVGARAPARPPIGMLFMAYAPEAERANWLRAIEPSLRTDMNARLTEVRDRGYSVGVRSPWHTYFESSWLETGERGGAGGVDVSPLEVPYDPAGFDLDRWAEVRSIHAPVFDAEGRVKLLIAYFLGSAHRVSRSSVEACIATVIEAADKTTLEAGGKRNR